MKYLHKNNWYHLHLHSGNILIEQNDTIKLSELENVVCNLPIKNEQYFNFIIEDLNYIQDNKSTNANNKKLNNKNDNNSISVFSDIFKYQYNVFEKIDIISFGRILYEMVTGKELKNSLPDELELKDMDTEIANILRYIFSRNVKNRNNKYKEVKIENLLNMKFFSNEDGILVNNKGEGNYIIKNIKFI